MMRLHRFPKAPSRYSARAASADCRQRGSSFSSAASFRPAGSQRGGDERHQQLVVAGNGVAVRFRSAASAGRRGGALHYILQRTVVLDKVEVRSGNRAEWNAEIAHHGNRFQKNLGQKNSGTAIEINASRMPQRHKGAEQTEIVMRG